MTASFIYQQPVQTQFQSSRLSSKDDNFTTSSLAASSKSIQANQQHFTGASSYEAQPQHQQAFRVQPQNQGNLVFQNHSSPQVPQVSYEVITVLPHGQQMVQYQQPIYIQTPQAGQSQQMVYMDQPNQAQVAQNGATLMPGYVQQPHNCYVQLRHGQAPISQQQMPHLVPVIQQQQSDPISNYGQRFVPQNWSNPGFKPYKSSPLKFYDQTTNSSLNENIPSMAKQTSNFSKLSERSFKRHSEHYQTARHQFQLSNRLMKLTYDLHQKDSQVPPDQRAGSKSNKVSDFDPKSKNLVDERVFKDLEPGSRQHISRHQIENDSFVTSEFESPQEVEDEKEPQNEDDQNQTLQEIVSSLSEKSNPNP